MLTTNFDNQPTYRIDMKKGVEQCWEECANNQAAAIAKKMLVQGQKLIWPPVITRLPMMSMTQIERLQVAKLNLGLLR